MGSNMVNLDSTLNCANQETEGSLIRDAEISCQELEGSREWETPGCGFCVGYWESSTDEWHACSTTEMCAMLPSCTLPDD